MIFYSIIITLKKSKTRTKTGSMTFRVLFIFVLVAFISSCSGACDQKYARDMIHVSVSDGRYWCWPSDWLIYTETKYARYDSYEKVHLYDFITYFYDKGRYIQAENLTIGDVLHFANAIRNHTTKVCK